MYPAYYKVYSDKLCLKLDIDTITCVIGRQVHVMSAWSIYWYTLPLNLTYLVPIPHLLPPRQYDLADNMRKECELYIPEEFLVRATSAVIINKTILKSSNTIRKRLTPSLLIQ